MANNRISNDVERLRLRSNLKKNRYSIEEYRKRNEFRSRMGEYAQRVDNEGLFNRLCRCEDRSFAVSLLTGQLFLSELGGKPFFKSDYCQHRLCPFCCGKRAKDWRVRVLDKVNLIENRKPVFLSLTMRGVSGRSLQDTGKILDIALGKFWRRVEVKRRIKGAVFVLQVKYNLKGGWWHLHVHALCDMEYWHQRKILEIWRSCLPQDERGDNGGVNIQLCKDRESGVGYVSSYISSGFEGDGGAYELPDSELHDLMDWLKGKRLMRAVGSLYGCFPELPDDEIFDNASLDLLAGQVLNGGNAVDDYGDVVDLNDSSVVEWSYRDEDVESGLKALGDWYSCFYFGGAVVGGDDVNWLFNFGASS